MSDKKEDKKENKNTVAHAHDKAFKASMSDLRVARDFLHHHLPEVIQEKIDLNTLTLHPTTFIDPELRQLVSDVLYSADFKDQSNRAFLYITIEEQSTPA